MAHAIYNEIDRYAVHWLRNLIAAGHIATGTVNEKSITELTARDIGGHGQRHFFAGIAGWSLALRIAGVSDNAHIWTGSCPCQGFSQAGQQRGFDDPRHLWPAWFRLIRKCRPPVIFGEQVTSPLGWAWLDLVFSDLEKEGYTCAAADLPACSVGAPHRRQRLFFVAYADGKPRRLLRLQPRKSRDASTEAKRRSEAGSLAYTDEPRPQRRTIDRNSADQWAARARSMAKRHTHTQQWDGCDWIPCSDGVSRPIERGTHPLAHGISARVGKLRAYGNAIVPFVAAEFIKAALDV